MPTSGESSRSHASSTPHRVRTGPCLKAAGGSSLQWATRTRRVHVPHRVATGVLLAICGTAACVDCYAYHAHLTCHSTAHNAAAAACASNPCPTHITHTPALPHTTLIRIPTHSPTPPSLPGTTQSGALLRQAEIRVFVAGSLLGSYLGATGSTAFGISIIVALLVLIGGRAEEIHRAAIAVQLEASLAMLRAEIAAHRPDVIVAGGRGAAVVLFGILKQLWLGPAVVLAPTHQDLANVRGACGVWEGGGGRRWRG